MRSLAPPKCILGRGVQFINLKFAAKISNFCKIGRNVGPFIARIIKAAWEYQAHTIIAKIAKLLSCGLRPIFGGGVRNNCNAICTSNVLRMITMMTIVLARVCDLPRRGCVSMCMNQW